MSLSSMVSILAVQQILLACLEERVHQSIQQEIQEFQQLRHSRDPNTGGQPSGDDIEAIFDVFLSRNIPEDGEYLLAIADGTIYRASSLALPIPFQADSPLVQRWAQTTRSQMGTETLFEERTLRSSDPIQIRYGVEPVFARGDVVGVW
ncbi:MAG: hypothetical protein IGR92_13310 [Leptolyngbyaceae cyanobacterium T60_A2020_046]|nr:hypothetical protein [Leptolyngbyaceae cyanobacterium T60_A2020_046]